MEFGGGVVETSGIVASELRELNMIRGFSLLSALSAGVLVAVIPPATASAATGDLVCTANFQINFNPPLTSSTTTSEVTATAGIVGCTSLNGNFSHLKSGTFRSSDAEATSKSESLCALLPLTITGSGVTQWDPPVPRTAFWIL